MSTVANEPIVPPPLPSFRLEVPKVASPVVVRAPPMLKAMLAPESIDPPLRLLMKAKMESAVRSPPRTGRDENICVATDVASVIV